MTLAHHLADMVIAMTTVAVEEDDTEVVRTTEAMAEMIVTVVTAEIVTITPHAESIATRDVTTGTAAVAMTTDEEVVEDTLIVMTEATVAPLAMLRQQPPMVILLLVERLGNHTEVEATTMRGSPVVNIDC
jgi:predicted nuclease of predicted toxin-antitoxin system